MSVPAVCLRASVTPWLCQGLVPEVHGAGGRGREGGPQPSQGSSPVADGKAEARGRTVRPGGAGRLQAKRRALNQGFGLISGRDLGSRSLQELQLQVSVRSASILGTLLCLPAPALPGAQVSGSPQQPGRLGWKWRKPHSTKGSWGAEWHQLCWVSRERDGAPKIHEGRSHPQASCGKGQGP